jgi:hypothetical protein
MTRTKPLNQQKLIQTDKGGSKMEDFFDDFMDEDFFEDNIEEDLEIEEPLDGDAAQEDEPEQTDPQDDYFTARDAFFLGSAIGWGYEEGLRERKRRKRKKFSDDSK